VTRVMAVLGVSERRACRVLGQPRSVQRYAATPRGDEHALTAAIIALASTYGRYGYRRVTALLRQAGWKIDVKRVERLRRREGRKVPARQPKRGRLWRDDGGCIRLRPEWANHVWSYDFVLTRTHDGRPLRLLVVIDEHTRRCLAIRVGRRLTSDDVLEVLAELFMEHGVPEHIRSDNAPEFVAQQVRDWLARLGVTTLFIAPGSPWENGYGESCIGELRDELLEREIFCTLAEARHVVEAWRSHCNHVRPHSSLGYRPPAPDTALAPVSVPLRSTAAGTEAVTVLH